MKSYERVVHARAGHRRASVHQAGFLSTEVLVGLSVLGIALAVGASISVQLNAYSNDRAAANDLKVVSAGALKWLNDNSATVIAAANPSVTYPIATFAADLPASFNSTGTNIFGQTYSLRVFQSAPGVVDAAVVTSGGSVIGENDLKRIANLVGGAGGYVSSLSTTQAQGAYGAWRINWSQFGGTPGGGHIANALFVTNASVTTGALYRVAVAQHPEYNQMTTGVDIDMNQNNLNNASSVAARIVSASTVNVQATGGFESVTVGSGAVNMDDNNQTMYTTSANGLEVLTPAGVAAPLLSGNINVQNQDNEPTVTLGSTTLASVNAAGEAYIMSPVGTVMANSDGSAYGNTYGNDYWINAVGKWASQMGVPVPLYQCPVNLTTGGGAWATFGCIGQVSGIPTCSNYWEQGGLNQFSDSCTLING